MYLNMTPVARIAVGCTLAAALTIAFLWSAPADGHLEGIVIFGGCPGTEPVGAGGFGCSYRPVPGAAVYASPLHRPSLSVLSDKSGRYQIDLAPGLYSVYAGIDLFEYLHPNGPPHRPSMVGSVPKAVWIVSGTSVKVDLGIMTMTM
jgi:hypothetical protein